MTADTIASLAGPGLPTLAVLVGILVNRSDAARLDNRMTIIESSLRKEISDVRKEISDVRNEVVSARRQAHEDVLMLLGHEREQDARITRLENTH